MLVLKERIELMARLGSYMLGQADEWIEARENASRENGWFTPEYIQLRIHNLADRFLQPGLMENWLAPYPAFRAASARTPEVGLVMAGNIPLVGFHDFLAIFLSGCRQKIKLSSKDQALWRHLIAMLNRWEPATQALISIADQLKGCDAYVATGSNNTSRYFEYYFGKYPHLIRRNRSSVALLTGAEDAETLDRLSDDINQFFGLGCRNVSKVYIPEEYDFKPLLQALAKYADHARHHKYKNNYDYQLALYLLNKVPYLTNDTQLLVPSTSIFAPVSVLHYEYYTPGDTKIWENDAAGEIQCIVSGHPLPEAAGIPVVRPGESQSPALTDYADGLNTLAFLQNLRTS